MFCSASQVRTAVNSTGGTDRDDRCQDCAAGSVPGERRVDIGIANRAITAESGSRSGGRRRSYREIRSRIADFQISPWPINGSCRFDALQCPLRSAR